MRQKLQSRSFSINTDPYIAALTTSSAAASTALPSIATTAVITCQPQKCLRLGGDLALQAININVIQPTPNISPSASLKSFSVDEAVVVNPPPPPKIPEAAAESNPEQPVEVVGIKNNNNNNNKVVRRVSFSEDETTSVTSHEANEMHSQRIGNGRGGSLATSLRQMTVPMAANATMSYLQVKLFRDDRIRAPSCTDIIYVLFICSAISSSEKCLRVSKTESYGLSRICFEMTRQATMPSSSEKCLRISKTESYTLSRICFEMTRQATMPSSKA
jgi:hypothetical protein